MSILNEIPSWLGTGIFGVLTFVTGFVSKRLIDRRQAREQLLQRLDRLATFLKDSGNIFRTQNDKIQKLMDQVHQDHPREVPASIQGFGDTFHFMYSNDKYTLDERRQHEIIRSVTISQLYRINVKLQEWLDEGYNFLSAPSTRSDISEKKGRLCKLLDGLRTHLAWWLAEYEATMPNDLARALVYSNDEHQRGYPFPTGIECAVDDVIKNLQR
jgi:hypothetical protein